jgi:DNA uptake protein ComE-like DNA-binding protein
MSGSVSTKKVTPIHFSKKQVEKIFINNADSTEWGAIAGHRPRLAQRIIRFRERLGGFYSLFQVGELVGLPDSVFQRIKIYLLEGKKEITHKY